MPTINVVSKKKTGVTITNGVTSSAGDQIITSEINSVSFVSEDISKQIGSGVYSFDTTHAFIHHSLEVFVNGMRLSPNADYEENTSFNGFSLLFTSYFFKSIDVGISITFLLSGYNVSLINSE